MPEPLTDEEFTTLVRLAQRVLWSDLETRQRLHAHQINVIPSNFYSEIPTVDEVDQSFEYRRATPSKGVYHTPGLFDVDRMESFVAEIDRYADEFDPPISGDSESPVGFYWDNPAFSYSDAMSYYCIVRHLKPKTIVEVGSGYSTLVADAALRKNGTGDLILIEPYAKPFLRDIQSVRQIIEQRVQDIELRKLVNLVESSNVWFIDSTHTVKVGSDCLYLYLKVMPRIESPTVVHTHDVALPYAPPKDRIDRHIYWTEQYLLYAYMLDNPKVEVLMGSTYLKAALPDWSRRLMRGRWNDGGGSLWYALNGSLKPEA